MHEKLNRAAEIFDAAVEMVTSAARAEYLDAACDQDTNLRAEVEELLKHDAAASKFLDQPDTGDAGADTDLRMTSEDVPTHLGPYKLLEQIGEGGFGVVFLAEQQEPLRRKVAIKIIKPGMDSRQVIARFAAERQTLALMDHPNISRVLDAGATDSGRPYFVMEFISGVPITEYCDRHRLATVARLKLFLLVCQAVQHAHQKGVIHRDLKPSNVLVTLHDGVPVVKIIDFGIAKAIGQPLTDKTMLTGFAQMVGTPLYMSPEQAALSGDIDTRSDIYSLGVLFYELLTGTTPLDKQRFKHETFDEIRRIIREEEPPKPSKRVSTLGERSATVSDKRKSDPKKLSQLFRADVDWIVMQCLEKDRQRRYASASDLARDIERYLNDEPVEACPPSSVYRFRKFVRRNKVAITSTALVALALIAGIVASTWLAILATQAENQVGAQLGETKKANAAAEVARNDALKDRNAALQNLYLAQTHVAQFANAEGNMIRLLNVLDAQRPRGDQKDLRGWEWYYLRAGAERNVRTLLGHTAAVRTVVWSPDGKQIASAGADGTVRIWQAHDGKLLRTWVAHTEKVMGLAWHPKDRRLATAGGDGTVQIWDADSGNSLKILPDRQDREWGVAWNPAGDILATWGSSKLVRLWNPDTAEERITLAAKYIKGVKGKPIFHQLTSVNAAAFSPDGTRLASADRQTGGIHVHDVESGKIVSHEGLASFGVPFQSIAWSPDGDALVSGTRVVDGVTLKHRFSLLRNSALSFAVAWSPKQTPVAISAPDGFIRAYDTTTGQEELVLPRQSKPVLGLSWSPDGRYLASAGADHSVKLWRVNKDPAVRKWPGPAPELPSLARDSRSDWVVSYSLGKGKGVKVWDGPTGKELATIVTDEKRLTTSAWSGKGMLATASDDGTFRIWDTETKAQKHFVRGHTRQINTLRWSPDGHRLASACRDGIVKFWDAKDGRELAAIQTYNNQSRIAFRPDWRKFVSWNSNDAIAKTFDADNGRELTTLRSPAEAINDIAWSDDGTRLAGTDKNGLIWIWDEQDGKLLHTLRGHTQFALALAWHKDSRRIASASGDGTIKIWDTTLGQELLTLRDMREPAFNLLWSQDGRQLIAAGRREILTWDASRGYELQVEP